MIADPLYEFSPMIRVHTPGVVQGDRTSALEWLHRFRHRQPHCVCVLGFTETALIPGISAAGATPSDRQTTALADAEFLVKGPQPAPRYPLPPLTIGISPAFITRAVLQGQGIALDIFNAGLPAVPTVAHTNLPGQAARCVTTGDALPPEVVDCLFQAGLEWGDRLAASLGDRYLIIGECVVGGTTTALSVLTGLGWNAKDKVNSSHAICNHGQKWQVVSTGLEAARSRLHRPLSGLHPKTIVAAVGDPMQPVVAGMAIAASRSCGVLLAGGTQMLAVYALIQAWVKAETLPWQTDNVVVGTTRWVAEDVTGDTVSLAMDLGAPLITTQLSFHTARYEQLRLYEQGFVKEGVAAGGCAIAASLYQDWDQQRLLEAIETLLRDNIDLRLKSGY